MISLLAFITGGCIGFIIGQYVHVNQRIIRVPKEELYSRDHINSPPRP